MVPLTPGESDDFGFEPCEMLGSGGRVSRCYWKKRSVAQNHVLRKT